MMRQRDPPSGQTAVHCYAITGPDLHWELMNYRRNVSAASPGTPVLEGSSHQMADMIDSIRRFIFSSLRDMNYETDGIDDDSQLGPRGADLASLALAELALRVEDEFGVKFTEEEAEELAGKTVGEFCAIVAERIS